MGINVNDIIGKGFVFEVEAEEIIEPSPTGTVGAFIGGADFGPINTNTLITGGLTEFYRLFGREPSNVRNVRDLGWYAAENHFKKSAVGYFTRLANVSSTYLAKAKRDILSAQLVASINGSSVTYLNSTQKTVSQSGPIEFSINGVSFIVSQPQETLASITFNYSDLGNFVDNNDTVTVTVNSTSTVITFDTDFNNANGLLSRLNNISGITATLTGNQFTIVGASGNNISISSFVNSTNVFTASSNYVAPQNRDIDTIVQILNNTVNNPGVFAYTEDTVGNSFVLSFSMNNSSTSINYIPVSNTNAIGFPTTNLTVQSVPLVNFGRFVALYDGEGGNSLAYSYSGTIFNSSGELDPKNKLTIFYQGSTRTTIHNFQFHDETRNDYILKKLTLDPFVSDLITYEVGNRSTAAQLANRNLQVGIVFQLQGGKSGGWRNSDGPALSNGYYINTLDVIEAIDGYSNPDLFDIDFICYPDGNNSLANLQLVQEALVRVCENRQDCFTLIDVPEGLEVGEALEWLNGSGSGRDTPLNSFYAFSYYPWLKVRYANNIIEDTAPSVKVAAAITGSDVIFGEKLGTPAGQVRGILEGVVGLERILSKEERDLLYADELNGRINPISFNISTGYFIDGNKTTQIANNSLRRINTVRTILFIKKAIQSILPRYFFEPSVPSTWAAFGDELSNIMKFLESKKVIESSANPENAWKVITDSSVNTPEVVSRNGMVGQISFVGTKSIERIKISTEIREQKGIFNVTLGD